MEEKLILWLGTYSDEEIIEMLKADGNEHQNIIKRYINKYDYTTYEFMSDEEIKRDVIDKGRTPYGISLFYAKDLTDAKEIAKKSGYKNFAQLSQRVYEKGKDY